MIIYGRKRICIISLIVLLGTFTPVCTCASDISNAQKYFDRKEYDAARELIMGELSSLSGNSLMEAKIMLAGLETDPEEAGRLYTAVLNSGRTGKFISAMLEMAKISYATGRYRDVIDILDVIPSGENSSGRLEAVYFKGLALKEIGDYEKAFDTFESIDRGKYLYWSSIALAELDIQYGRIEKAVERYETIAGSHLNPVAGFRLGECYEILGDKEKALDVYRNLARLFPESLEAPQAKEKIQAIGSGKESTVRRSVREGGEREETGRSIPETEHGARQYYTLQFGAFSVRENAETLLRELKGSIDNLTITTIERGGKVWYRIRAGRYPNREKAEASALKINEQTGYSGKVLPVE